MSPVKHAVVLLEVALVSALLLSTGCASWDKTRKAEAPAKPTPVAAAPAKVDYAPPRPEPALPVMTQAPAPDGFTRAVLAYPSGDKENNIMLLEKIMPSEIQVGQVFEYRLVVTATRDEQCVEDVVLTERIPPNFRFVSADPQPSTAESGYLRWDLGRLSHKESRTIVAKGIATQAGDFIQCAGIVGRACACTKVAAVEPKLQLTETLPAEVCICDDIPMKLVVTNAGSGKARNIRINAPLPEGLATADGKTTLSFDAGTLQAGESREFEAKLKAAKTGRFESKANASAAGELTSEALASTIVRQPVLAIAMTAPERQYIDRSFTHEITVTNTGDYVSHETMLVGALPADVSIISSSAEVKTEGGKLQCNIGDLQPSASRKISLTFSSPKAGLFESSANASGPCASAVSANARTRVVGIPALLLEMVDTADPVRVGDNETYIITITNQGSAMDTNIKVACILEETMQYVSSTGETAGKLDGSTVTFTPLGSLAPKAKAVWKVQVKAVKPGDTRFKVMATSDELTRPVEKTESTNFYE